MLKATIPRAAALRLLLIALIATVPIVSVLWVTHAASRTWTGGTPGDPACTTPNDLWNNPCNWSGKNLPAADDDLTFPSSLQQSSVNKFLDLTNFKSITISGGHVMSGNAVSLDSGITATNGTIALSLIKLNSNQTFNAPAAGTGATILSPIDNNGKRLTLDGPGNFVIVGNINGTGGLNKNGAGTTQLVGPNSLYSGTTAIDQGLLLVFGSQTKSNIVIGTTPGVPTATLGGTGTVGPISFGASLNGSISPGAASNGTGVLTGNGNLSFPGDGSLDVDLNGANPGSGGYDQLRIINGTVSLGLGGISNSRLNVNLGFTPQPGATFTILDNDGVDAIFQTFVGKPEGSTFTVNGTTFFITYRGGDDRNDVVLHVPTTRIWDGGKDDGTASSDNQWSTKENWVGDVAPQLGDDLVFPPDPARPQNNNNFPAGTTFNSITFSAPGYTLAGNDIALNAGITRVGSAGSGDVVLINLKLNANQTFSTPTGANLFFKNIDTNGRTLTLSGGGSWDLAGTITGAGGLTFNGSGLLQVTGASPNTFSGATIVNSGMVQLIAAHPNSQLQVNGGEFFGRAAVNSIVGSGGIIHPQFGGTMSSTGNVSLGAGVIFDTLIKRDAGSATNATFLVGGDLNLGNCTLTVTSNFQAQPAPGDTFKIIDKTGGGPIPDTFKNLPEGTTLLIGGYPFRISYVGGNGNDVVLIADNLTIQFNNSLFVVGEGDQRVNLTVTRSSGDNSGAASVSIFTFVFDPANSQNCDVFNGKASARCDYNIITNGIVEFAAGETSKTFSIPIVDDSYAEGNENFTVFLNNPVGAFLGPQSSTTVTIVDNDFSTGPNPIEDTGFFVRQHYLDFLSREPDSSGFNFWVQTITSCGIDSPCVEVKRINGSAAFYISIEFQVTGYLVERIYKAAYGDATGTSIIGGSHQLPVPVVRLFEFLPDTQRIGRGVVVGQGNWELVLENNKQALIAEFVQRPRFTSAFPTSMTPAQFVDKLNLNAGNPLSQSERDQLVNDLTSGAKTRAQVLRAVAEDPDLNQAEFNRAFVLMQYFGYLRRNPDDPPENTLDFSGYDFWLTKLNQFNGSYVDAEMVKAFITSGEYRKRFGPE